MLERFHVPPEDEVRVRAEELEVTVRDIFEAVGVPPEEADAGARHLITADLRGIETHGVSNMLRTYVEMYGDGRLNPTPEWRVLRDLPAVANVDGDRGLGIMQGERAMNLAVEKARATGVGVVLLHNSGHLGAVGYYAMLAAQQDMVGVCMTAAGMLVLPTFGAEPRLGTNPISVAAPAKTQPFLLYDAATSAIAGNKIELARRVDAQLEPRWIAALDGAPYLEPVLAPPRGEFHQLPLGGTREQGSHKGYGLALMVEVLGSVLAGMPPSMLIGRQGLRANHYFAAYSIAAFSEVEQFKESMDQMLRKLQDTPPAPGEERVIYPGIPEYEAELERREDGIPLHREVITWFNTTTDRFDLERLRTKSG